MKNLEDIKHDYLVLRTKPTEEEMKFYNISLEVFIKWRTEDALEFQKKLYDDIDKICSNNVNSNDKRNLMKWIPIHFNFAISDHILEDYYYQEIPKIYRKMYENDMFDYLSYGEYNPLQMQRHFTVITFANQDFTELQPRALVYENQKYAGKIPLLYYSGHLDVFEEILKYYANFIYQKYGLYIQESMNILIKFCKEYNLPYVDMLKDAKRKAKELDYPAHHEYKYQFISRVDVEWE